MWEICIPGQVVLPALRSPTVRKSNTQLGSNIDISLTLVTRTQRIALTPFHLRTPRHQTRRNPIRILPIAMVTQPHPTQDLPPTAVITSFDPGNQGNPNTPTRARAPGLDETTHVVPDIHNRRKGPKQKGLKELRRTNLLFRSLLSYRTYRSGDLSDQRTPRGTSKIKDHIKRLELTM